MTQNQTAATPTATEMENHFESARNAAGTAHLVAFRRRDALRAQMAVLQEQLALAERMVEEAGEAYSILSRIGDEEAERLYFEDTEEDYAAAAVEAMKDARGY
jgi:hypothetical protein